MSEQNRQYRIGDAERDQAVEFLREHHAQGRLDVSEFDERLTAALKAKTQDDLDRLFYDLPAPTPRSHGVTPVAPTSATPIPAPVPGRPETMSKKTRNTIDLVMGLLWPITIVACFVVGWNYWWLLFIPFVASSIWESRKKQERDELAEWEKKQLGPGRDEG